MAAESVPASPDAPDDDAPEVGVPPVVAVLVTHDPGPWLADALTALAGQDYPNLSVLVIDGASAVDPTSQVAAILPGAFIRRLDANVGFAAAANEVLGVVEGASHYVFLHDDAAPESDAIRLLVEEAYRSNAGVVAPKLVRWDDPTELLAVGMAADKSGVTTPFGRRELDQEQYDAVVDVFAAPGACTLVRADLFATLKGFDPVMTQFGEDLDLSWRAQVLGARVVVAPAARVRHLEATVAHLRPPFGSTSTEAAVGIAITRLERRHRLRSVFKNYGLVHLIRVAPQVAVLHVAEFVVAFVTGDRPLAGTIANAWRSTFRAGGLRAARRATQSHRAIPDAELRLLQARGSARVRVALQGGLAVEERTLGVGAAGRQLAGSLRQGGLRLTLGVWFGIALVLVVGSRDLLGGRLPAVGQFAPFPRNPGLALTSFLSGWRTNGLGSTSPAPFAFSLIGILGTALAGGMGLLQKLLVLGAFPAGVVGIFRLTMPFGSWRARLVAATLYAANPLPYDALRRGSWAGLVAYGAMPWILSRLLSASAVAPFGALAPLEDVFRRRRPRRPSRPPGVEDIEAVLGAEAGTLDPLDTEEQRLVTALVEGVHHTDADSLVRGPVAAGRIVGAFRDQWVPLAILLALTAAIAPPIVIAALVAALGLAAGALVLGDARSGGRSLRLAGAATIGAAGLLFPWSLDFVLPGSSWSALVGLGPPVHRALSLAAMLRFDTGPTGRTVLGWAPLLAAFLPLLIARRWRQTAATRLWFVAIVSWTFAWVAGRGWLGIPPPATDVLLVPAAVALATATALGLAAFEADLREYRFGWRQGASVVALAAGMVALVPVVMSSADGAWHAPRRDFAHLLGWMTEHNNEGAFRVLWVGDPQALPLDGWRLDDRLAFGTSRGGPPDATSLWPSADVGTSGLLADAVRVARRGETSRLGHLLAPMAVRYIAVPLAAAPGDAGSLPVPADLTAALEAQTDLRQIETDRSLVVYENAAWGPGREVLPPDALKASAQAGPDATRALELTAARPVLPKEQGPADFVGTVPAGEIYVAEAASSHWRLDVAGVRAPRRGAFGWANAFTVADPGRGRARFETPLTRPALILVEAVGWVFVVRALIGVIRRRRQCRAMSRPSAPRPLRTDRHDARGSQRTHRWTRRLTAPLADPCRRRRTARPRDRRRPDRAPANRCSAHYRPGARHAGGRTHGRPCVELVLRGRNGRARRAGRRQHRCRQPESP